MPLTINEETIKQEATKLRDMLNNTVDLLEQHPDNEELKSQACILLTTLYNGYSAKNLKKVLKHEGYM